MRIGTEVSPVLEMTRDCRPCLQGTERANKALLFENVKGIPVLINAFGSSERMA